jgi:3-hydroxybutyryl-CoA dehydrogenase
VKPRKVSRKRQQLLLVGELPLIEEFADLGAEKGYEVLAKVNSPFPSKSASSTFQKVNIAPRKVTLAIELTNINLEQKRKNLLILDKNLPRDVPILSTSVTITTTEQSKWIRNSSRLIGFSGFPTLIRARLLEVAPSIPTDERSLAEAKEFLWSLGREISIVQDRIGLVMPRLLCMLTNEAAFAVMEEIATPADIGAAMKLGTNYPLGPIEWGEKIGVEQVLAALTALYEDLGDGRYRAAPLLKQLAVAGPFWRMKSSSKSP